MFGVVAVGFVSSGAPLAAAGWSAISFVALPVVTFAAALIFVGRRLNQDAPSTIARN